MFNKETFRYFDLVDENKNNPRWFEDHKDLYLETVKGPFSNFLQRLKLELGDELPKIRLEASSICRPLRRGGVVKNFAKVTLAEPSRLRFEVHPAIHFQIGALEDDNFIAVGLTSVSARQMKLLRQNLRGDFSTITSLLGEKKFRQTWGRLQGETYTRFPAGYDPKDPMNQHLWHKQIYVQRSFSRKEVTQNAFTAKLIWDLKLALPFFKWVRGSVTRASSTASTSRGLGNPPRR